jgi:hypothetical protein
VRTGFADIRLLKFTSISYFVDDQRSVSSVMISKYPST